MVWPACVPVKWTELFNSRNKREKKKILNKNKIRKSPKIVMELSLGSLALIWAINMILANLDFELL